MIMRGNERDVATRPSLQYDPMIWNEFSKHHLHEILITDKKREEEEEESRTKHELILSWTVRRKSRRRLLLFFANRQTCEWEKFPLSLDSVSQSFSCLLMHPFQNKKTSRKIRFVLTPRNLYYSSLSFYFLSNRKSLLLQFRVLSVVCCPPFPLSCLKVIWLSHFLFSSLSRFFSFLIFFGFKQLRRDEKM